MIVEEGQTMEPIREAGGSFCHHWRWRRRPRSQAEEEAGTGGERGGREPRRCGRFGPRGTVGQQGPGRLASFSFGVGPHRTIARFEERIDFAKGSTRSFCRPMTWVLFPFQRSACKLEVLCFCYPFPLPSLGSKTLLHENKII
jgi:hypothetical protein